MSFAPLLAFVNTRSVSLNLDCVGCPGQATLPQFVQIGLNLWPKRKMTLIKWFPIGVFVHFDLISMLSVIIDEFINHTKWHFFICSTNDLLTLHAPDWFSMSRTSEKGLSVPNYYLHPIKASRSTASSQLNMFFCFQTMFMIMTMRPTAALDTTIFWSHSIKTSRNVTFRLSVACRTFPGKGNKIMISKSIWNFACSTDLTSLHKRPTNMHMLIIMCVLASL